MKLAVAHLRSSRTNCEDDSSTSYCSSKTNCEVDSSTVTVAVEQIVRLTVTQLLEQ